MAKTIRISGSTDGIGLETAKMLVSQGHQVLLHGRNPTKLESAEKLLSSLPGDGSVEGYIADLSDLSNVESLAKAVADQHSSIDVLINNAGVYNTSNPVTSDGLDVRFVVNAIAPYLLTQRLLPNMASSGRVVNLSSAAQSAVNPKALLGQFSLPANSAYAQSKLALTMWSYHLALELKEKGLVVVAVNPGSLLGSKMVKEAFGIPGGDIGIGAEILTRAALSDDFANASGLYFDNDLSQFTSPHPDALDKKKCRCLVEVIESILKAKLKR